MLVWILSILTYYRLLTSPVNVLNTSHPSIHNWGRFWLDKSDKQKSVGKHLQSRNRNADDISILVWQSVKLTASCMRCTEIIFFPAHVQLTDHLYLLRHRCPISTILVELTCSKEEETGHNVITERFKVNHPLCTCFVLPNFLVYIYIYIYT